MRFLRNSANFLLLFHKSIMVLLILLFPLYAQSDLEWQKIELEEKIDKLVRSKLLNIVDQTKFMVKTKVSYNDPGMPKFDDLNKTTLKISDIAFDDSKGDYIAFSKVGLEAPVIDQFHKDHQQKLKEMYRFKESFNLFKNIESILVSVTLSDQLKEDVKVLIKNVLQKYELSFGGIAATYDFNEANIEYMPSADELAQAKSPQVGLKEIMEFLGQFGNAIGMILTVLLLGSLALKVLQKYFDYLKELKAQENAKKDEEEEEESASSGAGDSGLDEEFETLDDIEGEGLVEYHFARFEMLLQGNQSQAIMLIKKWIANDSNEKDGLALSAVAQQCSPEDLELIYQSLDVTEREKWSGRINKYLEQEELKASNKYITEEIVREMISGSFMDDYELLDIILKLDSERVKNFLRYDQKFGPYLLNLLSPQMTSQVLDGLSVEEVQYFVKESLMLDLKEMAKDKDVFKNKLNDYYNKTRPRPFNHKIQQIISEVSVEKEEVLYEFLARQGSVQGLIDLAKKNFPGILTLNLPQELLKDAIQNYPMIKKVSLLTIIDDEQREAILELYPEGSGARDMLEMEYEAIEDNDIERSRILSQKDSVWKDFVSYMRNYLYDHEEYAPEVESIIRSWAHEAVELYQEDVA